MLDLTNKLTRIKRFDTSFVESSPLSIDIITETKKMLTGFFGLVPFTDVSVIPKDAEWNRIVNDDLRTTTNTIEIYELTWHERTRAAATIFNKMRFFIDSKTYLPQRTESYSRKTNDDEYALSSIMEVKYLSDSEMEAAVKEASF